MNKGKGGKSRDTSLTDDVTDIVHEYVEAKNLTNEDLLITNRFGKAYKSGCYLNRILKYYCS